MMLLPRSLLYVLALLVGALVLAGCDAGGSASETANCDSRTGNSMSATVNGNALCTDLGTALLSAPGPRLSVVGLFEDGRSTISFNVESPAVGTFDLTRADAANDAMYGVENETAYHVDRGEGSGSVTIAQLSDMRVRGTFEFTGIGYDTNGDPTGDQANVTNGTFDVALSNDFTLSK
jgi:hypothetical protein